MQSLDGYTTVTAWEKAKRETGVKIDGEWFREEVKSGRVPSIVVASSTFVRSSDLDEAWPRYCASREARNRVRNENRNAANATGRQRIMEKLDHMDSRLERILRALGVQ
jgi:(p)ppGpp synthase/HD superfamily hydrolase